MMIKSKTLPASLRLLLVSILAVAVSTGCATGGKSGDESQGDEEPPVAANSKEEPEIEGEEMKPPTPKESAQDLPKANGKVDSAQYQALNSAVRSGSANKIIDEAAKILATNSSDAVALNTLALYHFRRGKTGAAKLMLNRAFEKNPNNASLYNNLAIVLLEEGDQGGAIVNFKKALRINDRHPEALGNLGSLYAQGGDFTKALPLLESSYKQNRANASIANNYAIALRMSKNYDGAKQIYDQLLAKNSKDVSVLLNYAILLIDYMNKPKDGLALVYKVKFMEMDRKDVLTRANALEKKAKSELK